MRASTVAFAAMLLATSGCQDPVDYEHATGTVQVVVSVTAPPGTFDPDRLSLSATARGHFHRHVYGKEPLAVSGLEPGPYHLEVEVGVPATTRLGWPLDCVWRDGNAKSATIIANEVTTLVFPVDCTPPGGIRISTSTSGVDVPGSFAVWVDNAQVDADPWDYGTPPAGLPPGSSLLVGPVTVGAHGIHLRGLGPSCTVAGDHPRRVRVAEDSVTPVEFEIRCVASRP